MAQHIFFMYITNYIFVSKFIWYMIYDIWYMVYGIWYIVYGIWYMVYGIWYMVYGIWYMVYFRLLNYILFFLKTITNIYKKYDIDKFLQSYTNILPRIYINIF